MLICDWDSQINKQKTEIKPYTTRLVTVSYFCNTYYLYEDSLLTLKTFIETNADEVMEHQLYINMEHGSIIHAKEKPHVNSPFIQ